jgi:signal recognition particle GTPase
MGFLDRLKAGLAKTAKVLSTDVRDLFKREGRLVDDEFLAELRAALVKTDMGPSAAEAIVADVGTRLRARVVEELATKAPGDGKPSEQFVKAAFDKLSDGKWKGWAPVTVDTYQITFELQKFVDALKKKSS